MALAAIPAWRLASETLSALAGTPTDTYYFHGDHLGSTRAITNGAGTAVWSGSYEPFGRLSSETGTRVSPYLFTGQELDGETGLYYFGARYYDPSSGMFTSADSILARPYDPQSLNRYAYVGGKPLSRFDPDGHNWLTAFGDWLGKGLHWLGEHSDGGYGVQYDSSGGSNGYRTYVQVNPPMGSPSFGGLVPQCGGFTDSSLFRTPVFTEPTIMCHGMCAAGSMGRTNQFRGLEAIPGSGVLATEGYSIVHSASREAVFAAGAIMLPELAFARSARGGIGAVRLGQAGEAAVFGAEKLAPKTAIEWLGRTRIPDRLTGEALIEVKNVASLSYTRQLRDFSGYALENQLRFELWVRPTTRLSGPLLEAVEYGDIWLRFIP